MRLMVSVLTIVLLVVFVQPHKAFAASSSGIHPVEGHTMPTPESDHENHIVLDCCEGTDHQRTGHTPTFCQIDLMVAVDMLPAINAPSKLDEYPHDYRHKLKSLAYELLKPPKAV